MSADLRAAWQMKRMDDGRHDVFRDEPGWESHRYRCGYAPSTAQWLMDTLNAALLAREAPEPRWVELRELLENIAAQASLPSDPFMRLMGYERMVDIHRWAEDALAIVDGQPGPVAPAPCVVCRGREFINERLSCGCCDARVPCPACVRPRPEPAHD